MSTNDNNQPTLSSIKPDVKQAIIDDHTFTNALQRTNEPNDAQKSSLHLVDAGFRGVYYIDNVLTANECKQLCIACNESKELKFWSSAGRMDESARAFRDADTIEVKSEMLANEIWSRIQHYVPVQQITVLADNDEDIEDNERELVGTWEAMAMNHDFLFAKYPIGGAFAPHTDGRAIHTFNIRSFYSVIVFLNDIPANGGGGGTRFYTASAVQSLRRMEGSTRWTSDPTLAVGEIDAVAGRVLIFHQSLVHEGVPTTAPHTKHIIRSDIMYERRPAICDSETDREAYRIFKIAEDIAERGTADEAIPLFKKALKMSPALAKIMGQG